MLIYITDNKLMKNLKTKNENTKVGKKISESAAETVKTKFKKNNEKSVGTKRTNLNSEAKKSEKQNTKQNKINNFTKLKKGKSIKSKIENSENLKTEKVDLNGGMTFTVKPAPPPEEPPGDDTT